MPVVAGISVRYMAQLKLWESYSVTSRVVGWDEKWLYIEQSMLRYDFYLFSFVSHINFREHKNPLAARAILRTTFLRKGKTVPPSELFALVGEKVEDTNMPDWVKRFEQDETAAFKSAAANQSISQ